jgi:uncharacterized membrane protein YeaQ/YmgE (transglycosylase-associated protein family)
VLLLGLLVLGLFAGWVAQLLVGGGRQIDWVQSLVAGLVGSFVGGLIVSIIAGDGIRLRPSGIIGSIIGAVIVLAIWNAIRRSQRQKQQAASLKARRSGRHH